MLGGIFFFGAQEGEDYSLEDLTKTPNFTDYYPQDSSASETMKNGSNTNSGTTQFGEGGGGGGPTPPASRILYYYHPDYLGNVEYITDASGLPYQYFFYSPCDSPESAAIREGEGLVEQKATTHTWSSPYQFNGKEVDQETDLHYYGAWYGIYPERHSRLGNPQVSVWLGVDPLAHKYPSLSSYVFVANNPIMLVDPDGRQIDPASEEEWNHHRQNIIDRRNLLMAFDNKFGSSLFKDRINSLNNTISGMDKMADPNNETVYKIGHQGNGIFETYMNKNEEVVIGSNGTTEAFVHGVNHGIQFEEKKIAFRHGGGSLSSYQNEIDAYSAELAYSGELTKGINPNIPVVISPDQITRSFISGIMNPITGTNMYLGLAPLSISPDMSHDRINVNYPPSPGQRNALPGEKISDLLPMFKWKK